MHVFPRFPSSLSPGGILNYKVFLFDSYVPVLPASSQIMRNFLESPVVEPSMRHQDVSFFMVELVVITLLVSGVILFQKVSFLRRQKHISGVGSCPFSSLSGLEHVDHHPTLGDTSLHIKPPYKLPALKPITSPHMTMGLRRLDHSNWLTIDENYVPEHEVRANLLDNHTSDVLQCLPASETACQEVLRLVVSFLTSRYPAVFSLSGSMVINRITGEKFLVANNSSPLETAARLAMEDFNILVKDPEDDQYHLQASATLFPAGWKLQDRIGGTMADLHKPVRNWKNKLRCSVNRYFDHLSSTTAMERHPLFVQTSPLLFQCEALPSLPPSPNASTVDLMSLSPTTAPESSDIYLRRERQTFIPLPQASSTSGRKTILFSVHSYMTPLTSLSLDEIDAFVQTAKAWPHDTAVYKGRETWMNVVVAYRDQRRKEGN